MTGPTTDGTRAVTALDTTTDRLRVRGLDTGPADQVENVVVLVHGNLSSSEFFRRQLEALPDGWRGIAPDLRGFGGTDPAPVDATRGVRDYSDDVLSLLDALGVARAHLLGWSLGGGVVTQAALDRPSAVASLVLVDPVSPYGYGATRADGSRLADDDPGAGAGLANPRLVELLAAGERGEEDPSSPRNVMNGLYFAHGFRSPDEEELLTAVLSTRTGDDHYPGDAAPAAGWPSTGPGTRGVLNTLAPKHFDTSALTSLSDDGRRPPVLWVRGEHDAIVSDAAALDLAVLGGAGVVPGWPGEQEYPVQPMVAQTRAVLDAYAAGGGSYREVVLDAGHSPHVERPEEFAAALREHLEAAGPSGRG
ncbi:alpha/beta fold hydrolase [Aquipuribacter sp. SD81]|uniref:alpha/beta fold hydrolase n=1 Tax=Aquipuribacter sp. SD81 TaxID=3127703 RepID=UPI00301996CD